MAKRLSDGTVLTDEGRILYSDSILTLQEAIELMTLFTPSRAWPFISGGGGRGSDGVDGIQGAQGMAGTPGGPQGVRGNQGFQGNQGNQGFQGIQGHQATSGAIATAVFEFLIRESSASTGPVGFTPLFMIYSGCIIGDSAGGAAVVRSVGFASGVGAFAKSASIGVQSQGGVEVDAAGAAGDPSAIAGDFPQAVDPLFDVAYTNSLDVIAFGAGGIVINWTAPVEDHVGKILVVGTP